jgi:hypothetical protein
MLIGLREFLNNSGFRISDSEFGIHNPEFGI